MVYKITLCLLDCTDVTEISYSKAARAWGAGLVEPDHLPIHYAVNCYSVWLVRFIFPGSEDEINWKWQSLQQGKPLENSGILGRKIPSPFPVLSDSGSIGAANG